MKKSSEFLIGLFTCILLVVLYWGINFLKGENLFSNKRFYYALYENIDGLTISRPVTVNGFKVGQVSNISFQPGLLIIFPSHFYHSVPKNTTDFTRKSLSMNIVPKGKLGDPNSLTELWFEKVI